MFQHSVAVLILLLILSFQSICAKLFLISLKLLTFSKTPSRLLNFCFVSFYADVKMQLVNTAAAQWFLFYDVINELFLWEQHNV